MRADAAQQEGGARRGQIGIGGVILTRLGQPDVVDRVQAAEHRDDVRPAQRIVVGHHDQIPVRGVEARIEDLHGPGAALAQQPGGERGLASAAHGQCGWGCEQRGEGIAVAALGAVAAAGRRPAPGRSRFKRQRLEAGAAGEHARKRVGLAGVAGAAIADSSYL